MLGWAGDCPTCGWMAVGSPKELSTYHTIPPHTHIVRFAELPELPAREVPPQCYYRPKVPSLSVAQITATAATFVSPSTARSRVVWLLRRSPTVETNTNTVPRCLPAFCGLLFRRMHSTERLEVVSQ